MGAITDIHGSAEFLPSGELTFGYGKSPFFMGKSTISMAIFNCYVSSPEGSMFEGISMELLAGHREAMCCG